jgi:acyl-CoA thioesterase-1
MKVWTIGIAVVAALCAACTQSDVARTETASVREAPAVEPASSGRAPRIVFLGDSLTAGYGLDKAASVPSLIEARVRERGYAFDVVNAGVSGDTSAGGHNRLAWSIEGDVRILVIELGANDGLRGLPVDSLQRNLTEIITTARGRGIRVILTGMEAPPNFGAAYTSEFREVYRELAGEHDVTFVPFYLEGVAGVPALNLSDGMHPNEDGSRIIAETIWAALEPLLAGAAEGREHAAR